MTMFKIIHISNVSDKKKKNERRKAETETKNRIYKPQREK